MFKSLFPLLLFLLFFSGTDSFTTDGYKPVYVSREEAKQINLTGPRDIITQGKIYIKDKTIYVGDVNLGVHVIDNSDPTHPQKTAFIQIYGNHDIAIKGNILYADNMEDLVAIDISDSDNPKVVKRVEDVYQLTNQQYPENLPYHTYFDCADPAKGYVVGWIPASLVNPKCWTTY
jgi:hypothetical protein